jgi:hypothetical protein
MSSDRAELFEHVRTETAGMMGYSLDDLTPVQGMRLDLAVSFRLALDGIQAKIIAGKSTDVAELVQASQTLAQLLPALADEPPPQAREDARPKLAALIQGAKDAADYDAERGICSECERLKAENSALRSMLDFIRAGSRDPDAPPAPDLPPSRPPPPPTEPASPSPSASPSSPSPWNATSAPEPYQEGSSSEWRRFVNPDGSISPTPRTGGWPWS